MSTSDDHERLCATSQAVRDLVSALIHLCNAVSPHPGNPTGDLGEEAGAERLVELERTLSQFPDGRLLPDPFQPDDPNASAPLPGTNVQGTSYHDAWVRFGRTVWQSLCVTNLKTDVHPNGPHKRRDIDPSGPSANGDEYGGWEESGTKEFTLKDGSVRSYPVRRTVVLPPPQRHMTDFHWSAAIWADLLPIIRRRLNEPVLRLTRHSFDAEFNIAARRIGQGSEVIVIEPASPASELARRPAGASPRQLAPTPTVPARADDGPYQSGPDAFGVRVGGIEFPFDAKHRQVFGVIKHMWPPLLGQKYPVAAVKVDVGSNASYSKWATNTSSNVRAQLGQIRPFRYTVRADQDSFWWESV